MGGSSSVRFCAYIGFGLLLVVSTIQVWGGVFSFIPAHLQVSQAALASYLGQNVAFVLTFVAAVGISFIHAVAKERFSTFLAMGILLFGALLTISALNFSSHPLRVMGTGGVFSGVGSAALALMWQRYFASLDQDDCNQGILIGTMLGGLFAILLNLVPETPRLYSVPVLVLACGICLMFCEREMDIGQPMFQDVPRLHPHVYRKLGHDLWRTAVSMAAIGFACGMVHGLSFVNPSIGRVANLASAFGSIASALLLYVLGRSLQLRFGMSRIFRFIFPVMLVATLVFPFMRHTGLGFFAGLTHLLFSLTLLVMFMQTAQICRDRGTDLVFVFGLFCTVFFAAQATGALVGWIADQRTGFVVGESVVLSLATAFVMGMALFAISHGFALSHGQQRTRENEVEFLPTPHHDAPSNASAAPSSRALTQIARAAREQDVLPVTDRISKQCLVAQRGFGLSTRETEVMEHIARGHSVPAIAELLTISENTVRTHSKHIYTKLDIHSKAELSELLDIMDLSTLD